ncbi:DUF3189 family protein [Acetivibrio cellulolyticus]|uniref:DUF3189 family protein n=1 Tax=Acetivibrio cellulolyticus TaxID=35830 RepID=UPI0001E2C215|nr:DUF3189 family protein [Acetivibrio cellulolyticus]
MIYLYNCYGGTHSSSIASAVHLNKLPKDRIPTKEEILNVDYFNTLTTKDFGRIIFRGIDEDGNKVYTVGRGSSKVLLPCMGNLLRLAHDEMGLNQRIILSNTSPTVPFAMTMGGLFSRRMGIDFLGVPLLVKGVKQSYAKVVELVEKTRKKAQESNDPIMIIYNKDSEH